MSRDKDKELDCKQERVNVSGLVEGLLVKNYKEMCSLLDCSIRTGNSKRSQIKNWKRYFDFEKIGQKFLITEIYNEPFPTEDARKLREGLYVKYIELLLLNHLSKCGGYCTKISKGHLYSVLGLVNDNYKTLRDDHETIATNVSKSTGNLIDITTFDVRHFYQRADAKLTKILYTALDSMSRRFLIKYETEYVIILHFNDNNKEGMETKVANANEVSKILAAQNIVLYQMGCENIVQVSLRYKLKEFYRRVDSYLKEKYGWQGVFSQLSIIYINDIAKEIPVKAEEIRKLSSDVQQKQLNRIVIKSLNNQAEDKFNKNRDKIFYDLTMKGETGEKFLYQDEYIEAQEALADYLIDINTSAYCDENEEYFDKQIDEIANQTTNNLKEN